MSETLAFIVTLSLLVVIADFIYRAFTRSAPLLPRALVVVGALSVAYALAPSAVQTKDGLDETAAIVLCYFAMVLGMVAQVLLRAGGTRQQDVRARLDDVSDADFCLAHRLHPSSDPYLGGGNRRCVYPSEADGVPRCLPERFFLEEFLRAAKERPECARARRRAGTGASLSVVIGESYFCDWRADRADLKVGSYCLPGCRGSIGPYRLASIKVRRI